MNLQDFEAVWKRQELPRGADADLATVRDTFDSKSRKLAKALLVRDVLEGSTGVFMSCVLGWIWSKQGASGWPIGFAILLTLGVTAIFLRERIRAHRLKLGADASLLAKLEAEIAEVRHQRRLLLNVGKWYLAPIGAVIVIVSLTIAHKRPYVDWVFLSAYFTFCAFLFVGVWALNRRAVRKQLEPRLAELEKLRSDLLAL
jgi:hypothetical protein